MWYIIVLIISSLLVILGFLGIVLPFLPDLILIFAGALILGIFTHFEKVTPLMLVIFGIFAGLSFLLDYLSGILGAKKFGASVAGMVGTVVGLIVGIALPGFIFIIIMPVIGSIVGELLSGREIGQASKVGLGNFLGFLFSVFIKVLLAGIMIAWLVVRVVRQ